MRLFKKWWGKAAAVLLLACFLIYMFHEPMLNLLAQTLVRSDAIKPCDAIVVLAGDYAGNRLEGGIGLLKKGYGKYIVFWGGPVYWKVTFAELYLRQLKEAGVGPDRAVWSEEKLSEFSTRGEALVNMRLLREKGANSFILVTSDYHSARAGRVYREMAKKYGMTMYVHPVADPDVKLHDWWKSRASAKMVYLELEKSIWYKIQPPNEN